MKCLDCNRDVVIHMHNDDNTLQIIVKCLHCEVERMLLTDMRTYSHLNRLTPGEDYK